MSKFLQQDQQYHFPYHYLPALEGENDFKLHRELSWGLDYMTYMTFVRSLITKCAPQSVVDVGCGDGRLLHMIKRTVPRLLGVDLSVRALAFARAFNPEIPFECLDIGKVTQKFDALTAIEVLEHIPDDELEQFVAKLAQLLVEDGVGIISVPTVNVPLNQKHFRHFDLKLLDQILSKHFTIEQHWWLYRRGKVSRCLRLLLSNKYLLISHQAFRASVWRIHKKCTYFGDPTNGSHLVVIIKRKKCKADYNVL